MPMHKIEVDDVIYRYLKSKAEPFVDTPNTVLHRELLGNNSSLSVGHVQNIPQLNIPQLPGSTPAALQHIIEVVHLVKAGDYDRTEATKIVARRHGVARETIQDKYTRQLGLSASDFDVLLAEYNESKLIERLNRRFPGHESQVELLRENYKTEIIPDVISTGGTRCIFMTYEEALIAACRWLRIDPSSILDMDSSTITEEDRLISILHRLTDWRRLGIDPSTILDKDSSTITEEDQLISILHRLINWEGDEAGEAKAALNARIRMLKAERKLDDEK